MSLRLLQILMDFEIALLMLYKKIRKTFNLFKVNLEKSRNFRLIYVCIGLQVLSTHSIVNLTK